MFYKWVYSKKVQATLTQLKNQNFGGIIKEIEKCNRLLIETKKLTKLSELLWKEHKIKVRKTDFAK